MIAYGALLTILITVPVAVVAAVHLNRWPDYVARSIPLVELGMPSFWLALILILFFAVRLPWFPVGGYGEGVPGHLYSLFLPGLTIALAIAPFTIRSLRAAMVDVLDSEYVATARAKGISERRVLFRHVLRNALIPTITVLGVNIGWLVGNTLIVEKIYAIPGVGALMIDAILSRDFPIIQGLALVFGILVVLTNLATDLVRASLDPRVRLS